MASILYRKGTSHSVGGIQCEVMRVEAWEVDALLKAGCVANVNDLAELPDPPTGDDDSGALIVDDELPTDKDMLASIALEYGVTLDKRKSVESLQAQVLELMNGDKG